MDIFVCESDVKAGKVTKYLRPNPIGEDIHLLPDGTIERDEDKIIRAQRIFLHNWYRPGGKGANKVIERMKKNHASLGTTSCAPRDAPDTEDPPVPGLH